MISFKNWFQSFQMAYWRNNNYRTICFFKKFGIEIKKLINHVSILGYDKIQIINYLLSKVEKTIKICIGRGLAAIRAGKKIDKDFLFNFLQLFENEIVGNKGVVFDSISKTQIKNIEIPLPPLTEQKSIVSKLDALSTETKKQEAIYR